MIRLKVNGAGRQFDGDPEMPLLWYLRDAIQLQGTKFGCGQASVALHSPHRRRGPTQLRDACEGR